MKRTIGTALAAVTLLALFAAPAEAARPVPTCSIYHVVREDGFVLWFINVDNATPGQRIVVTATDRPDVDNVFELTGVTSLTDRQVHGSSGTEDVTATVRVESGRHVLCTASDTYTVLTWSCSFTVSDPVPGDGLSDYTWSVTTNTTDRYYGTILSTDANYAYLIPSTTGSSSGTLTLLDTDENGTITYLFFVTLYDTGGEVCRAFEAAA
jgi:hypothetical protein